MKKNFLVGLTPHIFALTIAGLVVKNMVFGFSHFWVQILAQPLASCVTLDELYNLPDHLVLSLKKWS